jgi:hypothetical protein
MGDRENALRRLFLPPDDDEEFRGGRGKRDSFHLIWIGFVANQRVESTCYFNAHTAWMSGIPEYGDRFDQVPARLRGFSIPFPFPMRFRDDAMMLIPSQNCRMQTRPRSEREVPFPSSSEMRSLAI